MEIRFRAPGSVLGGGTRGASMNHPVPTTARKYSQPWFRAGYVTIAPAAFRLRPMKSIGRTNDRDNERRSMNNRATIPN